MLVLKLSGPRDYVHPQDDAFFDPDREEFPIGDDGERDYQAAKSRFAEGWTEYAKTGNVSAIPLRDGRKPTIIRYKALTPKQAEIIDEISYAIRKGKDGTPILQPGGRLMATVAYGVVDILNLREQKLQPDGSIVLEEVTIERVETECGPMLSDNSLRLFADEDLRQIVYRKIVEASKRLTPEQHKSDRR